jgi:hypothetical protein
MRRQFYNMKSAKQLPSMNQRIADAYTCEFVNFIKENVAWAKMNFVLWKN